jgi:hypothetical protein
MATRPDAHGDSATHASPAERAMQLDAVAGRYGPFPPGGGILEERRARFDQVLHRVTPVTVPGPGLPPVPPPTPPPSVPPAGPTK